MVILQVLKNVQSHIYHGEMFMIFLLEDTDYKTIFSAWFHVGERYGEIDT